MAMILIWKNTDIDFGYTEVRRNTKNKNEGDSNMKFVLDTNIYLHYKLFTERDWKTLLGSEYLTLVVLPTVIKELDEKKYNAPDRRLKRRAQEVLTKFREINEGKPVPCGIQIVFPDSSIEDVDWGTFGLNSSNSDDRIIAAAIALKEKSAGDEVLIVTADFGLELKAKNHGIKCVSPPEDWKRETKDSRDKEIAELQAKLQKFQNAMPDVQLRLSAGDELVEILEISSDGFLVDILSDGDIDKELARESEELKSIRAENLISNNQLGENALSASLSCIPQSEITRYDKEVSEYLDNYSKYLNDCKLVHELRSLKVKIIPILTNNGSAPAEDIDILLKFPDDIVLDEANLPDFPEKPVRPKPPQSLRDMRNFDFPGSFIPELTSEILPHTVRDYVNQKGPQINESEKSLCYWLRNLKHGMEWSAEPAFAWFFSVEVPTFEIKYSIHIGNHPEVKEGNLIVKIEG